MQLQLLHLVLADQRDETEQRRLRQTLKPLPNTCKLETRCIGGT